ncbi:hypothetical protein Raf01_53650 [Rugosimonospora africana]|uniref:Glucanase n=1 Tax=Rugosimonospora africana TaxID=556532 RepID=A0A8J3QUR9_9ACTN|nr:hypothetical protein Raf01_53650 [Rugosimonospora africana]
MSLAVAGQATIAGQASAAGGARARHVDNPYASAVGYVDPQWRAHAESVPGGGQVSRTPTGIWLDRLGRIAGERGELGLRAHLDAALAQHAAYVQVVLNDLPARDCLRQTPGDFTLGEVARYESEFIDPIVRIETDRKYRHLRIINVVEVNALPDLVPNTVNYPPECTAVAQSGDYVTGIRYALDKLHPYSNLYLYLGAGDHGLLGWDDTLSALVNLFVSTVGATHAGLDSIDGIVTNTAGYAALAEPYFTADSTVNGVPVRWSRWVDFNNDVDELSYSLELRQRLVDAGFSPSIGAVIDTSRDGWGGSQRPTQASSSTEVNTFVDQSRIDRRYHPGNWCNQVGAGLGERPVAAPRPGVDGYAWITPPGVSDGTGDFARFGEANSGYSVMCDPSYRPGDSAAWTDGALPDGPPTGAWFPAEFSQLLANAYPPLG